MNLRTMYTKLKEADSFEDEINLDEEFKFGSKAQ